MRLNAYLLVALAIPFALVAQTAKKPAVKAAAPETGIPDFSRMPRAQVPEALTWKVSDLFPDEAAWRSEFEALKGLGATVEKLAQGWTDSPRAMADLLERLDEIDRRGGRVHSYTARFADVDMGNSKFQTMKGEVESFFVALGAKQAFVNADVLKLGAAKVAEYVRAEPRLAPFRFDLERILRAKDHVLPESEQRIASLTGLFAGAPSNSSGMLNNVDMPKAEVVLKDGTKALLNAAGYARHRAAKDPEDRRKVMEAYFTNQKRFEHTFAAMMDGNVKHDFFEAQIHRHPSCLDAALFGDAIDTAVYRNLIASVRANLAPLHRLLKLRQRMLGLPEFRYGDIYASAVSAVDRKFTFEEGARLVQDAMAPLGEDYARNLHRAFQERWIDIYPNQGKRSGAYSSGVFGLHPYVLMNYDGSYHEVSTLAHELGHAMHSFHSDRTQPHARAQYPIFLAEIASTFNERMLMNLMLQREKDDQLKLYLLDQYLEGLRGTLYRQTLFADFELAMHEAVEQGQTLTAEWLNAKYLELTRLYYGHDQGVVKVDDYIQSEWSSVPHFYRGFYVYQYATGVVASMALAEAVVQEGAPARERYLAFLRAGGSDYPLETLRRAGVDLTQPEPVSRAFKAFDRYVDEMERLVARLEKAKK